MTRRRRQKHKGPKRPKSWHRGAGEARRWARIRLPQVGSGADPTSGVPTPNTSRRRKRGTP